jgi:AcrR family transcriptional regulator
MMLGKTDTVRRRQRGFEATRGEILEVARDIMREEGVGALSLHEVARRIGVKTPSLYTYFESKHALYDEVFRLGMRQYRAEQDALEEEHGTGLELLDAVVGHYLRFGDENPELYSLLFERPVPGFVPSEASMAEAMGLLADSNRRVEAAIESGAIHSGLPVEQTRDMVLVLMHGLTSLKRANEPEAKLGEGRFGPLMQHLLTMLHTAWGPANNAKGGTR